jgi:hypothetical protein
VPGRKEEQHLVQRLALGLLRRISFLFLRLSVTRLREKEQKYGGRDG